MSDPKPGRLGAAIRGETIRLLGERFNNPMVSLWDWEYLPDSPEKTAITLLIQAGYLDGDAKITLAGMDYYRLETKRFRWLRTNAFPVFVAVLTAGATLGAGIITVWFSNRPC